MIGSVFMLFNAIFLDFVNFDDYDARIMIELTHTYMSNSFILSIIKYLLIFDI